jgi:RNA polymerase sigma-70 factor, ECF subfamily
VPSIALPLQIDALLQAAPERAGAGRGVTAPAGGLSPTDGRRRLEALVETEFDAIWRFVRRLGVPPESVEDSVQEVFAVAARRIADVRLGAEKSFLFGTALRVARGAQRRHARERARYEPMLADDQRADKPDPEQLLGDRRRLALLDELLESMQEDFRTVFVLFEFEGFTLSEIAELLQIPRGTVASRLRSAKSEFLRSSKRLRARLERCGGNHG